MKKKKGIYQLTLSRTRSEWAPTVASLGHERCPTGRVPRCTFRAVSPRFWFSFDETLTPVSFLSSLLYFQVRGESNHRGTLGIPGSLRRVPHSEGEGHAFPALFFLLFSSSGTVLVVPFGNEVGVCSFIDLPLPPRRRLDGDTRTTPSAAN